MGIASIDWQTVVRRLMSSTRDTLHRLPLIRDTAPRAQPFPHAAIAQWVGYSEAPQPLKVNIKKVAASLTPPIYQARAVPLCHRPLLHLLYVVPLPAPFSCAGGREGKSLISPRLLAGRT